MRVCVCASQKPSLAIAVCLSAHTLVCVARERERETCVSASWLARAMMRYCYSSSSSSVQGGRRALIKYRSTLFFFHLSLPILLSICIHMQVCASLTRTCLSSSSCAHVCVCFAVLSCYISQIEISILLIRIKIYKKQERRRRN